MSVNNKIFWKRMKYFKILKRGSFILVTFLISVSTKFTSEEAIIGYCPSKKPGGRKKTDF